MLRIHYSCKTTINTATTTTATRTHVCQLWLGESAFTSAVNIAAKKAAQKKRLQRLSGLSAINASVSTQSRHLQTRYSHETWRDIWRLETEPTHNVQVSRLSQERDMDNHVSRQSQDKTRLSRLRHWLIHWMTFAFAKTRIIN